ASVGGCAPGIQGANRNLPRRIWPRRRTGQCLYQGRRQPIPRNRIRLSSQRRAGRKELRFPQYPSRQVAVPAESIWLHLGWAGSDSEIVQRKEPTLLHVEL